MKQNRSIPSIASMTKAESFKLAALPITVRNAALRAIAQALETEQDRIGEANRMDLAAAEAVGLAMPLLKRLKFDEVKRSEAIEGILSLESLPDPLFQVLLSRELDKGLVLKQVTCPIGVIGVVFESRPDALVQIATLCLKSGNCAILKGGSEAAHTNRALFEIIHQAGVSAGVPEGFLTLLESREDLNALLACDKDIDLLIPRGSNAFVQYIMEHSKIPVMGHADGVCHVYADKKADIEKAIRIVVDAKTQYVAACNTVETLLIHKDIAETLLPPLWETLKKEGVRLKGCEETRGIIDCEIATEEDWHTEYLDYILSAKVVNSLEDAIKHINHYGSHHTDSIVSEDLHAAEVFQLLVDSAGVYHNCSTRFADGFRYGFGAEVGISTGKLHARGPVGLPGLVTYKYKLYGNDHIVREYAEGSRQFHFKDLPL
ncbi:MAG: glutamate-5-semialdehyde dehydrogenase [Firmicutes bacterium HGW-Firmicutes-11]|nr:MAG: glutamate-5-semialdehyde dehydrogenase [Firmicutes bacterium HGW-Firmicutes-11]